MHTRREFGILAVTTMASAALSSRLGWAATKLESTVKGVKLGVISGSFNPGRPAGAPPGTPPPPMTVDNVIADFIAVGAANAEYAGPTDGMPRLLDGVIGQPPPTLTEAYTKSRKAVRDWHMSAPLTPFHEARRKFDAAGLNWFSGVNTISADCDDEEIDAIFKQMAAMDLKLFCTNQTRVDTAAKMIAPAKKYGIKPAFHTHDKSEDPNEVASADSLVRLLKMSPMFMINLDIGHYTAGNQDSVAFIKEHHDRITHLHVKDRRKNHGPNVAWGTGDTPIKECLRLIRDNHYPIYAIVEREYHGPNDGTAIEETKKDLDYMRDALLT
jgi:sugar phosphate isomerase/epimerase